MKFQPQRSFQRTLAATLAALLVNACSGDSETSQSDTATSDSAMQSTLNDIQATVFTPRCSQCHTGGGSALPAAMDLTSAEASFTSLISVTSLNEPDFERVTPSNPDASYLMVKIQGTQSVGARMPLAAAPLDDETINSIRQWIALGAAP